MNGELNIKITKAEAVQIKQLLRNPEIIFVSHSFPKDVRIKLLACICYALSHPDSKIEILSNRYGINEIFEVLKAIVAELDLVKSNSVKLRQMTMETGVMFVNKSKISIRNIADNYRGRIADFVVVDELFAGNDNVIEAAYYISRLAKYEQDKHTPKFHIE